uniref:AP-1 complex subunit gamma n=2 Tax=Chlamydomonas leiostraca TaxID=1034604 RepID=A0A7S0S2A3_9CHLO|mmetsp:Transcript_36602/g.92469  ORF Transcript_36602/g.92469 Transcript_36602/m.92469 type:complete len:828 (+) Transcript_36602:135-2618(+)|eukprot:CAMPEP_0202867058 /NCGR_PEP_ID=MMETSP1391-20130828/8584_1 /ASSEMBLY_ACC=CAM_ASM_000867 /TAXON_ID=1034604 /ORGANISM="Chlamydomonas leiostraca, Strain SAG 11-49" /LENGTH=827 /DNA_ID=CAMNT_0049547061 /DNA_START=132 /DNA_END=2615 /DNA_ORIENTATION=+
MSVRLRELVRAVRACKTAAEEREVVAKESAALREAFRDQDANEYRHRNVAKLMYIHMLGYPTHFGQMETLKLIAATGFAEKRIGYLGLMILLDERQEVLMLVTNSVKMDMNHKNPYIAGLAMAALGNICSAEMARDLAPDVERIMENGSPYLRKKAALCAIRIIKKVPDMMESFVERAATLLKAADGAVQLAGVSLMLQIVELDPTQVDMYRPHVPALCQLLKRLLQPGGAPADYDVSGIANPFLQVKLLRLLRHLGRGHAEASDQMSDILAQVASNIDASRNAGNAVLYETVQTIMGVESIGGLRVLAVNTLGKFLANRDNNMRYVALNTLAKVVAVDTQAVQRHRATIVECVKDADVSIRRRALELVYGLVNEGNIRALTRELLDYLAVCDAEFKPDLTSKIATLIQRFAPDKRWHIDNLLQVMTQAGSYVKEEVCRALIVLITNAPDLHAYAVRAMYRNLHAYQDVADTSLLITSLWCVGEFGEMLVAGSGVPLLEGEPAVSCSDRDIVDLVATVLAKKAADVVVREYALTAAMKLTARLPGQVPRLQALLARFNRSAALEVQSRSSEYTRMFKLAPPMRAQLLERMPALDEAEYLRNMGAEVRPSVPSTGGAAAAPATSSAAASAGGAAAAAGGDLLGDLGDALAPASTSAPAAAGGLDDLLAVGPVGASAGGVAADVLDLLDGGSKEPPAPPAPPPEPVSFPPAVVFQGATGVAIRFAFHKPGGKDSGVTEITATYANAGPAAVTDFNVQAAVPKFMQLRLEPASGTTLPGQGAGAVVQKVYVNNSQHGVKALAMRLRISYKDATGSPVVEQTEVTAFPAGC